MTRPIGEPETYERFRSGLTFAEIAEELRREQRQALDLEGRRMFITRRTVLGRWMQRKGEVYASYVAWHRPAPSWWPSAGRVHAS